MLLSDDCVGNDAGPANIKATNLRKVDQLGDVVLACVEG